MLANTERKLEIASRPSRTQASEDHEVVADSDQSPLALSQALQSPPKHSLLSWPGNVLLLCDCMPGISITSPMCKSQCSFSDVSSMTRVE
jgi:hypothetical protein